MVKFLIYSARPDICQLTTTKSSQWNPASAAGQPCIRGMRITVYDVLEYLAGGMSVEELLHDFPELTQEDIRACFAFAAAPKRREKAFPAT